MTKEELTQVYEALISAYEEIEAMEETYDDYVAAGRLMHQLEQAMLLVEKKRGC